MNELLPVTQHIINSLNTTQLVKDEVARRALEVQNIMPEFKYIQSSQILALIASQVLTDMRKGE